MELSLLMKLFESIGFPAVIFVIWYIYHNAQVKTFEKIISNNFEILKDLVETNQYNATVMSRIESKINCKGVDILESLSLKSSYFLGFASFNFFVLSCKISIRILASVSVSFFEL